MPVVKKSDKLTPEYFAEDEGALFRASVGRVRPLADSGKHSQQSGTTKPVLRSRKPDAKALFDELNSISAEEIEDDYFLRPGLQQRVLRRLRRAYYPVEDHLDLHNLNQREATKLLLEFLAFATDHKMQCIKIIHGKGLGSKNRLPVLKQLTADLLRRHPQVQAFTTAKISAGGTGAVCVLLKST